MIGKQKILIVDDDENIAELISLYLTKECFDTKIVYNGKDAVERAVSGSWQMILLDVMLPGRDGFSVCRKIREQTDTPIFFITARVMEEDELNGYAAGADDYITKPFSLPVLYAKVMAMTGRVRGSSLADLVVKGSVTVNLRTGVSLSGDRTARLRLRSMRCSFSS